MRLVFLGTPVWAVPSLTALARSRHEIVSVVTAQDAPVRRSRTPKPTPVKARALELGIERVLQPPTLRGREPREAILAANPDLLVVVAYGRILPGRLLDSPPLGAVNVHFSLLPRHRGASPVQYALLCGDTATGVTTMKMDRGLDTGDVYLARETPIRSGETAPELGQRLAGLGAELLLETLETLEDGELTPRPQPEVGATFAPPITREMGRADWSMPALEIERRVRALAGWPRVTARSQKGNLKLLRASATRDRCPGELPGRVLGLEGSALRVACGADSVLLALEVQPEGKRAMTGAAALAGRHLRQGEILAAPEVA